MLKVDEFDHTVDVFDLVATEHQAGQIGEVVADIVDTGDVIVGQFQETDEIAVGSTA